MLEIHCVEMKFSLLDNATFAAANYQDAHSWSNSF